MGYSLCLGKSKKDFNETLELELAETIHSYIFERYESLIKKDLLLHRMSDPYGDSIIFHNELNILITELDEVIHGSSDEKLNIFLGLIKSVCLLAVIQNENIYGFGD